MILVLRVCFLPRIVDEIPFIYCFFISEFNIIIVDGTWTQAKKVARSLPESIPHVRLISTGQLAFKAPMRTQSKPDRICTLGAIIQLLSVRFQPLYKSIFPSHFFLGDGLRPVRRPISIRIVDAKSTRHLRWQRIKRQLGASQR
jgi:hypothetical protein